VEDFDKVILVDKPAGITSFGVVARVRRKITEEARAAGWTGKRFRVGHTGTLDPFATGLMIILTGKETKNAGKYSKLDKVYEATIKLGATSTTGDPEGEITLLQDRVLQASSLQIHPPSLRCSRTKSKENSFSFWRGGGRGEADAQRGNPCDEKNWIATSPSASRSDEIEGTLKKFTGKITQTPPIYSAIKINGERAYKLARKGEMPKMPSRQVEIYDLKLLEYDYPILKIRAHVSSGTYIRTLAEDIGKELGTGAYTAELRRTKIADYDVKDAEKIAI
jgi:tRNA pseudouridine55 synthase